MEMHEEMGGGKEEKMSDKVKDYPPYLDYPKERKPMTNADRIRSMADEELVELLAEEEGFCCPVVGGVVCLKELDCQECFARWLKQEAE